MLTFIYLDNINLFVAVKKEQKVLSVIKKVEKKELVKQILSFFEKDVFECQKQILGDKKYGASFVQYKFSWKNKFFSNNRKVRTTPALLPLFLSQFTKQQLHKQIFAKNKKIEEKYKIAGTDYSYDFYDKELGIAYDFEFLNYERFYEYVMKALYDLEVNSSNISKLYYFYLPVHASAKNYNKSERVKETKELARKLGLEVEAIEVVSCESEF